ncbi:MAG: flagellar biosynthesis protein FlhA [Deltaproteobacteria bacterium]|nr:flagellar biosynthesis protein FlhA [Deltaproteobacteria bacterium]
MPTTQPSWLRRLFAGGEVLLPLAFVIVILLMVIPVPTAILDLFLALNISLSLMVLLLAIYTLKPLEFSTFPSVLLVLTLFRLSLNVASTRLILGKGAEGPGAAGHVIQAFGNFVVGGSYVVGTVIFLILVVINFVVITKGAGRIAEVAARFTLDAMPGKQLAVDAELNAGLLSEREARERRRAIEAEADFYGAMDGASKFVRGDAIAGVLIAAINIVGGLIIGVLQGGLSVQDAAQIYTTLTVGDGLVSQMPALLVSTAAGIIVTRAASGTDLGSEVTSQLLLNPRVMATVSAILVGFAVLPGLPTVPFLGLAGAIGGIAWAMRGTIAGDPAKKPAGAAATEGGEAAEGGDAKAKAALPSPLDVLELEVGFELVPLVDGKQGGELIDRIRALRTQLGQELGIAIPPVHIRDNLQLKPGEYAVLLKGVEIARAETRIGYVLAINPGAGDPAFPGIPCKEPAFGLEALWVPSADRERAQISGYTVVDVATVVVTHLTELIRRHAADLLGRQDVQVLLDALAKTHPKPVEELVPQLLGVGGVQKVLQNLLRENVSVRDLLTVIEALADHAPTTKDPQALTEQVRQALSRSIVQRYLGPDRVLHVMTLAPTLERTIGDAVHRTEEGATLALEPALAQRLLAKLAEVAEPFALQGRQPVLLCSTGIRGHLRRFLERFLPSLVLLAPAEIPPTVRLQSLGVVRVDEEHPAHDGAPAMFNVPRRGATSAAAGAI